MKCSCLRPCELCREESRRELEAALAEVVRIDAGIRRVSYERAYGEYVMTERGEYVHSLVYGPLYGRPN